VAGADFAVPMLRHGHGYHIYGINETGVSGRI
jgi:hypothetical protein